MAENDVKINATEFPDELSGAIDQKLNEDMGLANNEEVTEVVDPTAPVDDSIPAPVEPAPETDSMAEAAETGVVSDAEPEDEDEEAGDGTESGAGETSREKRLRSLRGEMRRESRAFATTENMHLRMILNEGKRPSSAKNVFRGTVISVRPASGNMPTCAVVSIGSTGLSAIVPYNQFFANDPLARDGDMPARIRDARQLRLLRNSIGAHIPFVIIHAESDGNALGAVASRTEALTKLQARNYFNRDPSRNIAQSRVYEAHITAVDGGGHTIWVELGGVEVRMFPGQITYRPLTTSGSLRSLGYAPGGRIRVQVDGLELDTQTRTVKELRLNAARPEAARLNRKLNMVLPGSEAMGTITRYTARDDGKFRALVWLDNLNMPARVVAFPQFTGSYVGAGVKVGCSVLSVEPDATDGVAIHVRITRFYGLTSGMMP